jgi:hypothetical protein
MSRMGSNLGITVSTVVDTCRSVGTTPVKDFLSLKKTQQLKFNIVSTVAKNKKWLRLWCLKQLSTI